MPAIIFLAGCNLFAFFSCQKSLQKEVEHHKEYAMQQEAPSPEGSEFFLLLSNGEMIPIGKNNPNGFYVRGEVRESKFYPISEVLGTGELATTADGRYGWFELTDRKFYEMQSGRQAQVPFVKGYYSDRKGFLPSVRMVFQAP